MFLSAELWVGLLLLALIVLSTTANLAIRHISRVRLSEELERRGKSGLVDRLVAHRPDLLLSTSAVRVSSILALVLLIVDVFGTQPVYGRMRTYAAVFTLSLLLVMIMGVAVPNAWARYAGDAFIVRALPLLLGLRVLLYPLVVFLRLFDDLVRRLAGVPRTDEGEAEADLIEREILGAISEAEEAGAVHEEDAEMIESVIEFRDKQVGEIMTPRTEIVAIPATATLYEVKEVIAREGHSRIPIFSENIDDIKGVLYAKDLLRLDEDESFDPTEIMRKVPFVPESKRVADLLRELRERKVHLAIVLDEYGGTSGLVTIEDIVEEIIGEIADEYEAPEPEPMRRIDDHTLEVDARVHVDYLAAELEIELPETTDYYTLGGFFFSSMGKIPAAGEEYRYNNVRFQILDAEERKINRVRVEIVPEQARTS
ncbi:MAG: membrane protein [Phycisphaerae bacterium]